MLQYEIAEKLYKEMKEKATGSPNADMLYKRFLKNAVDYAKICTSWSFMDRETRMEEDEDRSIKHNALISILEIICRNLGIEGVNEILPDRKMKGDFACYVSLFLALEQR